MVNYTSIPAWSETNEALRKLWGFYWDARTAKPTPLTVWQRILHMFQRSKPAPENQPIGLIPENEESLRLKAMIKAITEAITTREAEIRVADRTIDELLAKKK